MEILISILAMISLIVIILAYISFSWGYVIHKLYGWFILNWFGDVLPEISVIQFIGITFFIHAIITRPTVHIKEEYKDKTGMYASLILSPWITLLIGWALKTFIIG